MGGLGRLGIPAKIRRELGIEEGDKLFLSVECGVITIRKVTEVGTTDRKANDGE